MSDRATDNQLKFMGLTKTQFLGVIITCLVMVVASIGFQLYRQADAAREGAETHAAVCAFKADLERRVRDSERFIAMTLDQRIAKYGKTLGEIPPSVIRQSLRSQEATVKSLSSLHC